MVILRDQSINEASLHYTSVEKMMRAIRLYKSESYLFIKRKRRSFYSRVTID